MKRFSSSTDGDPTVAHIRIYSNPVDDLNEEIARKLLEQHVDGAVIVKRATYQIIQIVSAFFLPQMLSFKEMSMALNLHTNRSPSDYDVKAPAARLCPTFCPIRVRVLKTSKLSLPH